MIGRATSRASLRSAGFSDRAIGARPPKQSERSCSRVKKKLRSGSRSVLRSRAYPSGPERTRAALQTTRAAQSSPDRRRAAPIVPSVPERPLLLATPSGSMQPRAVSNAGPCTCTLQAAPCTLHSAPCTLHLAPCTLHPPPSTPAPCTLHPAPCTLLHHAPRSSLPAPCTPAPLHPCTPGFEAGTC